MNNLTPTPPTPAVADAGITAGPQTLSPPSSPTSTAPVAAPTPLGDPHRVISAQGLLVPFNTVGVLDNSDVHLAQTITRLHRVNNPMVTLAIALTHRAVRQGSSCLDVRSVKDTVVAELLDPALMGELAEDWVTAVQTLPWPEPADWLAQLQSCPIVGSAESAVNAQPMRLVESLVFLERHWAAEESSRTMLRRRLLSRPPVFDPTAGEAALAKLFDRRGLDPGEDDRQAMAALVAARSWTSVIAGGPGTGKTTTVARLLALLNHGQSSPLSVALAAPSGKAAARLHSSVMEEWAALEGWDRPRIGDGVTIHRLLGARGRDGGFAKGPTDPLTHDVVVVDEVSMLDLFSFERLLSALSPRTRLVLVGDPHQLSSVEAGRVLADLTHLGLTVSANTDESAVVELERNFRFSGSIQQVARSIVQGKADQAVAQVEACTDGSVELINADLTTTRLSSIPGLVDDIGTTGALLVQAATRGDASAALTALDGHRLLCAHREGAFGVSRATWEVSELLREQLGTSLSGDFTLGRPVLANSNQSEIRVFNGDVGVMVQTEAGIRLAMGHPSQPRLLAPSLVDGLQTLHAMTVHKSQGSQFEVVSVLLPPTGSPLLTRELLYTALTRAKTKVRLIGSLEQVKAAVNNPTQRLTGLGRAGLSPVAVVPPREPTVPPAATS